MRVEMLGHASLLVQSEVGSVLFDPLFYGKHHEGVYDVYPPRSLDVQQVGHFDAVVISHAHADHFDLPSISLLPRTTPIIIPADPEIASCLHGLGFTQLVTAREFEPIQLGQLELIPTPAAAGAIEHGYILRADESTVWNMIDSFPSQAAIERVLEQFGPIDLLITPWQPLHDTAVSSGAAPSFPHGIYSRILTAILRIQPRVLVPGACGFWAVGAAAWTNKLLFPLTLERFVSDLSRLDPNLIERIHHLDPGDAIMVTPRGVSVEQGLSASVKTLRPYDWRDRAFRPLDLLGPPVLEHRGAAASEAECGELVRAFFEDALPEFIAERKRAFDWHDSWGVVYQYEVVFDADSRQYWTFTFAPDGLTVKAGEDPMRTGWTVITAGLLVGLIASIHSWEFAEMSGELRRFGFHYLVDKRGLHVPHTVTLVDPLTLMLSNSSEHETFRTNVVEALDREYKSYLRELGLDPAEVFVVQQTQPMVQHVGQIDPTSIANSVMKQIQLLSLDTSAPNQYGAIEASTDEKHDAS